MKYGFIGCGNMGGALIRAAAKTTKDIMIADFDNEKAVELANELRLTVGDNKTIAAECDRIFLGVKPQVMAQMLDGIKDVLADKKPTLISMAAGLTTAKIKEMAGEMPVIRIMPNTPVSVGKGVVLYCANDVAQDVVNDFVKDMQYSGKLYLIDEGLMDAGCSVSGCGPAFMYTFASAIAKGGEQCGLSKSQAIEFAAATMAGAAQMLLTSDKTPEELTDAVCSKGGSTIEGVTVLKNSDFENIVCSCIKAAYKRNRELGK
ncbi:MAG: pyrroline-5-carboxylate reductase [Clostridia bacterium]|nr:pyrroline-5-carboxylate reductase [Clostridia bacterium]